MSIQIFSDYHLATMQDAQLGIITDGAIAIENNKIIWLGKKSEIPPEINKLSQETFFGQGRWILPGLIDCHTHLVYAGNRAEEFSKRLQGVSYAEIAQAGGGILNTVRQTREITQQDLYKISEKRLLAMINQGVTRIEIKSGYGLDCDSERKMLVVAKLLAENHMVDIHTSFLAAHALPPEYDNKDAYIDEIITNILPALHNEGLIDAVDGFCETIGFSADQIERLFKKAEELKLPVKLHAEQLSDQQGASLAARFNALSADHLEYASQNSIQAMREAGTVAVLLPGAFYYLQEKQLPPVNMLRDQQVPMAIATDCNPGSSPTTSLLLMLNMACVQFGLTPQESLLGVTKQAAKALGVEQQAGTLEVGKLADFSIWNIDHPQDLCYEFGGNPCYAIVYAGNLRRLH